MQSSVGLNSVLMQLPPPESCGTILGRVKHCRHPEGEFAAEAVPSCPLPHTLAGGNSVCKSLSL